MGGWRVFLRAGVLLSKREPTILGSGSHVQCLGTIISDDPETSTHGVLHSSSGGMLGGCRSGAQREGRHALLAGRRPEVSGHECSSVGSQGLRSPGTSCSEAGFSAEVESCRCTRHICKANSLRLGLNCAWRGNQQYEHVIA